MNKINNQSSYSTRHYISLLFFNFFILFCLSCQKTETNPSSWLTKISDSANHTILTEDNNNNNNKNNPNEVSNDANNTNNTNNTNHRGDNNIPTNTSLTPYLITKNSHIINEQNQVIILKGFSWFGFNDGTGMVTGLTSDTNSLASDFATVVLRQKMLGFNAVRLPFTFADLDVQPASNIIVSNCTLPTAQQLQNSTMPPNTQIAKTASSPTLSNPPQRTKGICNDYVPNDNTYHRYLWTVEFFAMNGFYVLIDDHLRPFSSTPHEEILPTQNSVQWVTRWQKLAKDLWAIPAIRGHLMIDIINEPDGQNLTWQGNPAIAQLYLSAMDAIYSVAPGVLFFVQGCGQGVIQANWGDGFVTNTTLIAKDNIPSNPIDFFTTLQSKSYANQVVISPHVYGPHVSTNYQDSNGVGFYQRLSNSFGYLNKQGFCLKNQCSTYAIAIGEFGSIFYDPSNMNDPSLAADRLTMQNFADYLNNSNAAKDGLHQPIENWFYWCWNENSTDTGGLVGQPSNNSDWHTINWQKIQFLQSIGLKPWYAP